MSDSTNPLRALPSVDALLNSGGGAAMIDSYGRDLTVAGLRYALDTLRQRARAGVRPLEKADLQGEALDLASVWLAASARPTLQPVINATGIIIHTNLGRAPLSQAAQSAIVAAAAHYSTLEYDLDTGKRGSRSVHAEALLRAVTGAEAALVVNNNAAALVLILSALALNRRVIISRGQLVEIGGGFRVPEVMAQSGAVLVEVGTTNRTRAADYERAIAAAPEQTAMLLHAHASNFKQIGFVEETPLDAMADIAHRHGLLMVDDLGSGALLDTAAYGLEHEPTVQESLRAGVDLVAFSGDKLLGGPQAGIIVGTTALVETLKRHPLARAIRADKLCLAALTATLEHYRRGEALDAVPVWQMIARPLHALYATAQAWAAALTGLDVGVIEGESAVGGGSLPGETLPTALLALAVPEVEAFVARLRTCDPPVIARIKDDRALFDPRTVFPEQEDALLAAIKSCLNTESRL